MRAAGRVLVASAAPYQTRSRARAIVRTFDRPSYPSPANRAPAKGAQVLPAAVTMSLRTQRGARLASSGRGRMAEPEAAADSDAPPLPDPKHPALMWINEFTKFGVSAAAFGTLVYYHNAAASYALSGSIANSIAGKILKRVLNVPRPGSAPKADPGMPSSHALSLAYLSTYACAAVLSANPADSATYPLAVASAVSLQSLGLFLTWLRVHLGYHTVDQVAVGYTLGVVDALLLFRLGETTVLPALQERPELESLLYGVTTLAIGLFAVAASKWVREAAGRLGLRISGGKSKDR